MNVNSIRGIFAAQGYIHTHETKKRDEFQAPFCGQFLYLFKERDLTSFMQIVIHPDLKFEPFLSLPAVTFPRPDGFHHGSNMRQFPKRKNRGKNEIHYGKALEIDSLEALARFLQFFKALARGEAIMPASLPSDGR